MPTNNPSYQRDYMRRYRAAGRDRTSKQSKVTQLPFVGCDGEGITLPSGYHAYCLLRIGDRVLKPQKGNERLTTLECLKFICESDPNKIYVGYFFDYDATKILEDLPWKKMQRLVNRATRTTPNGILHPVDYLDFQIEYLPRKELKVRKLLRWEEQKPIYSPWITINDVGSFFQTSFLQAIKAWNVGSPQEWEKIERGKRQRASFADLETAVIDEYNLLEIRLLEQLMDRFRDACIATGYVPNKWQGPGLLAEAMLRGNGVLKSADVPLLQNQELVQFALNAYYGGRSEISVVGPVPGPVYQYDINSAYPYAMQFVPCLQHGKWSRYDGTEGNDILSTCSVPTGQKGERYALAYGSFAPIEVGPLFYGLPIRTDTGTIVYPAKGRGWYWSFEIAASIHQRFLAERVWLYERVCECAPLAFVRNVYKERQRLGKNGPGIVLKIGMNSLYGKTVQSIGMPKYSNPIWGSFITALPRMMIQEFIHSSPYCGQGNCGKDILMIATDSVACRYDFGWPTSTYLGDWSCDVHHKGMLIVQPGVYFGAKVKTRGVPLNFISEYEEEFRRAFDRLIRTNDLEQAFVSVPQKLFCGLRYAVFRRSTKLAGQWIELDGGKDISFDWTSKRAPFPALAPTENRPYIQTFPYLGSEEICTIPYDRNIGGLLDREKERIVYLDQPDWNYGLVE